MASMVMMQPLQVQNLQQLWDGLDLVALYVHGSLPKHQVVARGPSAHHMQGRLAFSQRRPEGLAIQGNDISWDFLSDIPNPGQEAFAEGARLDQQKHPIERIGAGNAVGQWRADPCTVLILTSRRARWLRAALVCYDGSKLFDVVAGHDPDVARLRRPGRIGDPGRIVFVHETPRAFFRILP